MKLRFLAFCFGLVFCPSAFFADEHSHMDGGEKLGTVSFPISCSADVQSPFERGVALLHSFEYEQAEKQFREVAAHDSACPMAYWGQAMSLFHGLWDRPSEENLKRGEELLEKARQLKPKTARERDYVAALNVIFRDPDKSDYHKRLEAYARSMERLHERIPQDREAAVFYALALLASSPDHDLTHANAKKAVAILNQLFDEQPDHPGIAHYIIHACDNPQMAPLALAAARKYASIAPSSPHAVHMPSHIFARLGLWQDDIQSNAAAIQIADKMSAMHLHVIHHKLHSMDFLEYAYLQIGDDEKAKAQIDAANAVHKSDTDAEFKDYVDDAQLNFPAVYAIERRQWKEALNLQPSAGAAPSVQTIVYWAHAIAAGHLHDAAAGRDALAHFDELIEATRKGPKPYVADSLKDQRKVVEAWALYAQGKNDDAQSLLHSVADQQDQEGKGETELPAREMLADMLLDMNRPAEALAQYEVSLKTDPNRFNGLYGAAHAAEMLQQKEKAAGYYAQLLKNCEGINSDRPELATARTLVAAR
jgi:tetratricopeptide (TPR) repeat protein